MKKLALAALCSLGMVSTAWAASHGDAAIKHARVTSITVKSGMLDQAIGLGKVDVVAAMSPQEGYEGYYLFVNGNDMQMITIWSSEQALSDALQSKEHDQLKAKLKSVMQGAPVVQHFQVLAADLPKMHMMAEKKPAAKDHMQSQKNGPPMEKMPKEMQKS